MYKAKISELALSLRSHTIPSDYEKAITEWLEQNQPEPVVVGLSDKQIADLCVDIADNVMEGGSYIVDMCTVIKEWQKTQTFAQPDVGNTDSSPNWDEAPKGANWVAQDANGAWYWFFGNKPVPLGEKW